MSFKVCVSLLIFCLVDLSIGVSGVLKSPTITVLLLISSFILVSICLTYCGAPVLYTDRISTGFSLTLTSLVAQTVKRLPTMRETQVQSLDGEKPLEKEIAIHSSTLA